MKVFGDRVFVLPDERDAKAGCIEIPTNLQEEPITGTVVAAGKGKMQKNGSTLLLGLKEGDRVLFDKYSGREVQVDGRTLFLLDGPHILATLEKEVDK